MSEIDHEKARALARQIAKVSTNAEAQNLARAYLALDSTLGRHEARLRNALVRVDSELEQLGKEVA